MPLELSAPSDLEGCWVFGAGDMGRFVVDYLRDNGVEPAAFLDNSPDLHGRTLKGLPIASPSAVRDHAERWIVVAIKQPAAAIEEQCRALGARRTVRAWHLVHAWAATTSVPHYVSPREEFVARWTRYEDVVPLLADDVSRTVLAQAIRYQITCQDEDLPPFDEDEYTFPEFPASTYSRIVDCGAYDGDTLRSLVRRYSGAIERYDAFEPDPDSFQRLAHSIARLPPALRGRVHAHRQAVGARAGQMRFQRSGGMGSALDRAGDSVVEQVALDEALPGQSPTLLKADVEGAELECLEGATDILRRCRPALAICVYHRPDHYLEIPRFLHGLELGYRLFLRHHTRYFTSTVCYALPAPRGD